MEQLIIQYARKLITAGLSADTGFRKPLVGAWDDEMIWNRSGPEKAVLEQVLGRLSINSLTFVRPRPPYDGIIEYLARHPESGKDVIAPKDCETRTFLHDLPVVEHFTVEPIIRALTHRKSVIVRQFPDGAPGPAILAHGTVSPEQGFVTVSSVCFASFVKFFGDYLEALRLAKVTPAMQKAYDKAAAHIDPQPTQMPDLMRAPFKDEAQIYKAITQAGRFTVAYGLVDSYFGNISYCRDNQTLYISQTGSSLDQLTGCIDPVPLDGSTSAGMTASSELSAHLAVVAQTGCRTLLHGHPKFAVILSMDCDSAYKADCPDSHQCHLKCPRPRSVAGTPIVPGEVGSGPHGLCHTLPAALKTADSAIVHGHGLFTTGRHDFQEAFETLLSVETRCRQHYFDQVRTLGHQSL